MQCYSWPNHCSIEKSIKSTNGELPKSDSFTGASQITFNNFNTLFRSNLHISNDMQMRESH